MDIYTQQVYEDQRTFDMMVATYPVLYAHLGADLISKYNAVYATTQEEKHNNNLCQFKLQMNIKGKSQSNFLRVNTYCINEKPAIPTQKVRYLHINQARSDKRFVLVLNNGVDYYYSVDDHSWLGWENYYENITTPENIIEVDGRSRYIPERSYRVYDMEKLEAEGEVYHFHSITRKVTCGGKEIVDLSDKDLISLFPNVPETIAKINTVRRDNKLSTLIYMDYEDCIGTMRYQVSVQGLARKLAEIENVKVTTVADRIRKTIKAKRIVSVGKLNGKDVYVSLEKIDLETALKGKMEHKDNAEDRYKMTKRIKTWLVRHEWKGTNKKWTAEELQLAFVLVNEHNNK